VPERGRTTMTGRPSRGALQAFAGRVFDLDGVSVVLEDPCMHHAYALLERLAASHLSVLMMGETGTGKELAARALHAWSTRREGPMVSINCAALPETIAESELFGYERGAFSGAVTAKPGLFEIAQGGTIFLDEIGDLSVTVQAKLLRVLENRRVQAGVDTRNCGRRPRLIGHAQEPPLRSYGWPVSTGSLLPAQRGRRAHPAAARATARACGPGAALPGRRATERRADAALDHRARESAAPRARLAGQRPRVEEPHGVRSCRRRGGCRRSGAADLRAGGLLPLVGRGGALRAAAARDRMSLAERRDRSNASASRRPWRPRAATRLAPRSSLGCHCVPSSTR